MCFQKARYDASGSTRPSALAEALVRSRESIVRRIDAVMMIRMRNKFRSALAFELGTSWQTSGILTLIHCAYPLPCRQLHAIVSVVHVSKPTIWHCFGHIDNTRSAERVYSVLLRFEWHPYSAGYNIAGCRMWSVDSVSLCELGGVSDQRVTQKKQ